MPVALTLTLAGRGPEGLARLAGLPAVAAEVPLEHTGALVIRGGAERSPMTRSGP